MNNQQENIIKIKKRKSRKKLGSDKAVETMYKNAYRAELDIISLATTKANIMISLNGFIISALMISGVFIFSSAPVFLVPANIFLLTAASSMIFALLSASPNKDNTFKTIFVWIKNIFLPKPYSSKNVSKQTITNSNNVLIYEDRVMLSKERYWQQMCNIMENRESVYFHMSEQLYWLGKMADRQFRLLNISYSIFRSGLLLTIVFVLCTILFQNISDFISKEPSLELSSVSVSKVKDVYEPSGVTQLKDGRLLVIEDEASRAFSLLAFNENGALVKNSILGSKLTRDFKRKIEDLEGLATDDEGFIYAITSHSKTQKGKLSKSRTQLLRFKINNNTIENAKSFNLLIHSLNNDKIIQSSIKQQTGKNVDFTNINIEGLEYFPKKNQLLLGFRTPVINGLSMIIPINNPKELFNKNTAPKFGKVIFLNLDGGGIRSLDYEEDRDRFLIANELTTKGKHQPQIWSWSGNETQAPKKLMLPELLNVKNIEALDSIKINGKKRLLMMSDSGDIKKHKSAKYILLDEDTIN